MNIHQNFKIISFSTSETKLKKLMGNFMLEAVETGETVSAKMWEEELNTYEKKSFKPDNVIYIDDGNYNEQYKNIIIKKMTLISEAKSGLDVEEREIAYQKLLGVVTEIQDEKLKMAILDKVEENKDRLKIAPAAKNNHHNFIGGLLQHTLECIDIAKSIFSTVPQNIDKDLFLAACIMHDFGKVFEYNIDTETGFVEINEDFIKTWVSHTLYGFSWANQNGFKELARVIAAHHGRKDWGAVIDLDEKNLEPEVYLMHHIDDISAKFGKIKAELL